MRRAGQCPVCCSTNQRAFLCASCVNKQILNAEQHQRLDQLRAQRNALLESLDGELARRAVTRQQQIRRWQKQQDLKVAHAKAQRAEDELSQAQQQLAQLAATNRSRRHTLEQLNQQTAAARSEVLGNTLPTVLRYQSLTLSHVSAMLAREQRNRLRELTEIFPLRINAVRSSGGPIQITICNLRLPESGSTPAGGWPEPQSTSAAAGYLLLFVDQVALIMGGPILHESCHQASTSSIWQPSSFWNRQPASPAAMLPLHVMSAGAAASAAAGQAAYNSATSRYLATANFWGPSSDSMGTPASIAAGTAAAAAAAAYAGAAAAAAAFTRATGIEGTSPSAAGYLSSSSSSAAGGMQPGGIISSMGATAGLPSSGSSTSSSGGGASGGASSSRGSRGRESDFKAAWDLLQRSLACFLKDKAARNGMQLPSAWNPIAWLTVYCAVVKKDSRQDGKLVAASYRAEAAAAAAAAAGLEGGDSSLTDGCFGLASAMSVGGAGGAAAAGALPNAGWAGIEGEGDLDEEDEGWVVQTTFLPPPPSQPDEVEHWARAMYADGNALAAGQQQQQQAQAGYGYGLGLGLGLQRGLGGGYGIVGGGLTRLGSGGLVLSSSPSSTGGMLPMERIRSLFGR